MLHHNPKKTMNPLRDVMKIEWNLLLRSLDGSVKNERNE
jgi:hypothetical protein